tara:strand:- start:3255 stop:4430 length:1176 start_codon:yes stop_codon:yes gene_type:complete
MSETYEQLFEQASRMVAEYGDRIGREWLNKGTPPPPPPAPDPVKVTAKTASLLPFQKQLDIAARMGQRLEYKDPETGEAKVADFRGAGATDMARQQYEFERGTAPQVAADLLALGEEYGPQYVEQRRRELELSDPEGFAARQQLGQELLGSRMADTDVPVAPDVERLTEEPLTAAGRRAVEENIYDNVTKSMVPALLRRTQQAQRARGTAAGNILGDASALRESLSVQLAEQGQKGQALGQALALLQSGQTTGDTANRMKQANLAMGTTGFQNQMQQAGFQQGLRQQDVANLQGYAFGQPLSAQFGMMQGAQRGATPYAPLTPQAGMGMGQMYGQNAQLMGSNYGTQASLYSSQLANTSNPWMQGLGFVGGAFGGPLFGALGASAAKGITS